MTELWTKGEGLRQVAREYVSEVQGQEAFLGSNEDPKFGQGAPSQQAGKRAPVSTLAQEERQRRRRPRQRLLWGRRGRRRRRSKRW